MIFCLDVGNTDIDAAVFTDGVMGEIFNISYTRDMDSAGYVQNIAAALDENGICPADISGCVVCSVVKAVTENLCAGLESMLGIKPLLFRNDENCNMEILTDNPAEVGTDIIVGCFAVKEKHSLPAVVIDMGTATSVTAMDKNGAILGVSIITGTMTTLNALHTSTGLPIDRSLTPPPKVIGTNTPDSIASGIVYGSACMMDGMIARFEKEMGCSCNVYATGGLSKVILPHCDRECSINSGLLLEGLYLYYMRSKK